MPSRYGQGHSYAALILARGAALILARGAALILGER
jgi:hypothetical protein